MCGRVTAVLLSLFLFFSGNAFAVCDFQLQHTTPLRASYLDLAIDGSDLWAATGHGAQLFELGGNTPRLIDTLALPGVTRSIRAANGVAYAASGRTIHVLRKNGSSIERVKTIEVGGTVNDLLISGSTLFAAITSTSSPMVVPFALASPLDPAPLPSLLTSGSALSLASNGSTLFVADGDATVEVINGSVQQPALATSLVRALAVNVAGSRLYVSDGQQTEVFALGSTITSLGKAPIGIVSLASVAGDIALTAGNDRRYRVVDLSVPGNPIELFAGDIAPTGGSINRIGEVAIANGRFYIAGGDGGLLVLDASSFAAPFPLRSYSISGVTSVATSTTAIYAGTASGISELARSNSSGSLTLARSWAPGAQHVVHESANNFLLSSSGAVLTFWTVVSTTPAAITTSTFRASIKSATFVGTTAYALLDDGSVWTADLVQAVPAPVQAIASGISHLAANDDGVFVTQIREDGSTEVRFYARGNFATPASAVIPGAATALASTGSTAAVFTFRGINLIDFPAGTVSVLAGSANRLVTDMAITGTSLVDMSEAGIRVWNLQSRQLTQELRSPSEPFAVAATSGTPYAAIATYSGVSSLKLDTTSRQPQVTAILGANDYQREAVGSSRHLYLFDGQSIDVYDTAFAGAPRFVTTIAVPGAIDIAATDDGVFVLGNNGAISRYSPAGARTGTTTIDEGADVLPLAIFSVRGAPWVSISKGCLSTGCEKQTLVFDPAALVRTAAIAGGAIDVISSGNSAWALFDLPSETRAYDTSDRLHPALRAARPSEASATALALNGSLLYVIGSALASYDAATLTPAGTQLGSEAPSATTRLTAFEGCGIIAGRSGGNVKYAITSGIWTAAGDFPVSGNVRSFVQSGGRLFVLSDYSLDIWSSTAGPQPVRRRATR